jgi:predicted secreted Zn-dependent protease
MGVEQHVYPLTSPLKLVHALLADLAVVLHVEPVPQVAAQALVRIRYPFLGVNEMAVGDANTDLDQPLDPVLFQNCAERRRPRNRAWIRDCGA